MSDKIRAYYDENPQREWDRLDRYRFEYEVSLHHLNRVLKPGSRILDVGGGPGRYAFELTKRGHSVVLMDLSEGNIGYAKKQTSEQGVSLESLHVGNAIDLSKFANEEFDAVIAFGPLYHLPQESDRERAIQEALRVCTVGGVCAFAFLSIYAPVYDMVKKDPSAILGNHNVLKRFLETGIHVESESEPGFTDIYMIDPFRIEEYMSKYPLKKVSIVGTEGLTSQSEGRIAESGEAVLSAWIEFAKETSEYPGALATAEHIVFIGKKA